jgi:cytochrome c-type biogenesis protein CcmH
MTGFWAGVALLAAAALSFLLFPLWGERRRSGRWPAAAVLASVATVPVAIGLYLAVTSWNPTGPAGASPEERAMVAQLAAKMVENPDDVAGWRLLGRSYMVLGEYALGRQAYVEAWNRTPVPDNELKLALAEALILTDRASVNAEGGQLVEEVLRAEPDNQRALWYGGLVAMELGRTDLARARWTRFLAFNPPEEVAGTIRRLLAQLPADAAGEGGVGAAQGADAGFALELAISVAAELPLASVGPDASLFIFARAPGERAPVAVIREPVSALPGKFVLSDRNVMIAGRSLTGFPELALVARVSLSGQPAEQSGDFYAEASFRQGDDTQIALVIDKVVP